MFKKILVPLDGSELSELALPYAEELARALDSEVTLIFVCEKPNCLYRNEHQAYVDRTAKLIKEHIEEQRPETGVKPLVLEGHSAAEISDYTTQNDISLIVMATHGRSGIISWAMGSVADKILHGVNIPVFLVRARIPPLESTKQGQVLKRILVPLDGSEAGEAALPYIRELAKKLKLKVDLLQVIEPGQHVHTIGGLDYVLFPEQEVENLKAHARQYLADVSKQFTGTRAIVRSGLKLGDPTTEIIKATDKTDICLVAMSTHGHTGITRWTFGGITNKVLHGGKTPVLLVRPTGIKA